MAISKVTAVVVGCLGCFILLGASCGGVLFYLFRSADSAASPRIDALFTAVANNTFGNTYLTDTTSEFRSITSEKQYDELGETLRIRLGALKSKSIRSFYTRQMNANTFIDVTYNATFEKGTGTITARLQNVNGKWLFASFRVDSPVFQKDLATRKCPKCGEPHAPNAKFCPACGASLEERAAKGDQPEQQADEQKADETKPASDTEAPEQEKQPFSDEKSAVSKPDHENRPMAILANR
jgi:hypothetical protein